MSNIGNVIVFDPNGISKVFLRENKLRAHRKGAKIVFNRIKNAAPVRQSSKLKKRYSKGKAVATYASGNLKRSITTLEKHKGKIVIGAKAGGRGSFQGSRADGYYIHMVERGTKYSKAQPFVQRSFDSTKDQALSAITKEYETILKEYLRRQ